MPIGIGRSPFNGWMKTVHDRMNLKAAGIVHPLECVLALWVQGGRKSLYTPDSSKIFLVARFKDTDIEAMANAMGCSGHSREACTDNCDPRPTQHSIGGRWIG